MFRQSLSIRLAFLVSIAIAIILVMSGAFITSSVSDRFTASVDGEMKTVLKINQSKIQLFNEQLESSADNLSAVFGEMFSGSFTIDSSTTVNLAGQNVPSILSGAEQLVNNYKQVDRFAELTGGNATIFVRRGDDFIRVTTSVKKEDGSRAVGTLLSRTSPAYAANMSGQSFTGKVTLFGRPFVTNYTPLKDSTGQVIGIRYIGLDFSKALETISQSLSDTSIGHHGHIFIVDNSQGKNKGDLVMHPAFKGQNISAIMGRDISEQVLSTSEGFIDYMLKDGAGEREWYAYFITIPELNWVVAATLPKDEFYEARSWAMKIMLIVTLVTIAVVTGILISLSKVVVGKPLEAAVKHMNSIASGDYSGKIDVDRVDEVGLLQQSLLQMQGQMKQIVGDIIHTATDLASAAEQLSVASGQVAEGSSQQSAAASNMASTIEQLTVSIDRLSENAEEAQTVSSSSNENAMKGAEVIQQAGHEMQAISHTVTSAAREIGQLGELSGQISSIIQTIQEIADQTNLLALNAAIEAARAGEQGRGFAVVADEVRGLAGRTSSSAQEITATIDKIQQGTKNSVSTMESGVSQVEEGAKLSAQAGEAIEEIQAGAQRVVEVFTEISLMLREQAQASTDIARNVEDIAQMAEINSASVTQVASSASELRDMAGGLKQMVSKFKIS